MHQQKKVWDILGNDFANINKWAVRMLASSGDREIGPIGGRRVTTVEYGDAVETLLQNLMLNSMS